MRPGAPHIDGTHARLTHRRVMRMGARELRCLDGHRLKPNPYVVGYVILPCFHKETRHAEGCRRLTLYALIAPAEVIAVDVTPGETHHLVVNPMGLLEALTYLGVDAPEGLRRAA